jgi:hypothetical protein
VKLPLETDAVQIWDYAVIKIRKVKSGC